MKKNGRITLRLGDDLHRQVKRICVDRRVTMTEFIVDSVKRRMKQLKVSE